MSQSTRFLNVWRQPGRAVLLGVIASASLAGAAAAQETGQPGTSVKPLSLSAAIRDSVAGSAPAAADEQAPAAPAQSADSAVLSFFRGTELSGFVDTYYSYNFNKPSKPCVTAGGVAVFNCLRNFDVAHNSFSLSLAEVALEKKPTAMSRGGFRVDLDYGPTTAYVHATEPGGTGIYQNIQQAYLSYLAPVGSGLQLDFGKFVTLAGNEVIESKDNWNYSRSLLFAWAIPYYHVGMRATYSVNDKFSVAGYLLNGWNDAADNNTGKTVAVQATIKPTGALSIIENYVGGPEQPNNNSDWRHLTDTIVSYTVNKQVSVAANYDYGQETVLGSTVKWQGIAGYVRYQHNDWFALTPRVEYYNDRDGYTTGAAQKVKEVTVTGEIKHKDGVMLRIEYRHDFSDVPFFLKNASEFKKNQGTFTLGLVYSFSSKTP